MKCIVCFLIFFGLSCSPSYAQLKGLVRGVNATDTVSLNGAKIKLLVARKSVLTNSDGKFEIYLGKIFPDTLVILYPGFYPDTVLLSERDRFGAISAVLYSDALKPEVLVERKSTNGILKISIAQVDRISNGELRRAACCNLSESFETNAAVDVNITDAVSGARKIQLLGLDGVYTQFQLENIPFLRGIEAAYGVQSFSGIWLDNIQISKGTGSVVNGFESMAGLINLSVKSPFDSDRLLVNAYGNRFGRFEGNLIHSVHLNDKWATSLLMNASMNNQVIDDNRDGFLDLPLYKNAAFMNRWQYNGKKMEAQFGVYGYLDDRFAGQSPFHPGLFPFHMEMGNQHLEFYSKTGFFGKKPGSSLGIIQQIKYHNTSGYFGGNSLGGQRSVLGSEKRYFVSLNYDRSSANGMHQFKSGITSNFLDIKQHVALDILNRTEFVSGVFSEYALLINRLSLQIGTRLDYHSLFSWNFVPRVHAKYALTPKTDLRITAGKGWRVPNFLIENNALLANNKTWTLPGQLLPEISWNVGTSLVTEMQWFKRKVTWTSDIYYTHFNRQLTIDRDVSATSFVFTYIENQSRSLACQTELDWNIGKRLGLRLAYKYLQVESIYNNQMQQQSMIPKHRILITSAWASLNKRWQADVTANLVGSMRMPQLASMQSYSPWYPYVFGQVSHQWKHLKIYLGVENLLNYKQPDPIRFADQPQHPDFDATMVWGPITGINIYGGFTYSLKQKKS